MAQQARLRDLGVEGYVDVWSRMKRFTDERTDATVDEIWTVEHPPVYTLGQAGKPGYIHDPGGIDVVQSDRGGQVTYHGPGQLVCYLLLDLTRLGMGVRDLVTAIERTVIDLLAGYNVCGETRPRAPGVYVAGEKIAALGLRIRRGCCYHGLSLNVDVDLGPFANIDPCGYADLQVTSLARIGVEVTVPDVRHAILTVLAARLGLDPCEAGSGVTD